MFEKLTILYNFLKAKRLMSYLKTKEDLNKWQKSKILSFKKNVLPLSPFYKEYVNQPLSSFPIVNKKITLEQFNFINTANMNFSDAIEVAKHSEHTRNFTPTINDITIGLSSGTSGKQSVFLASKKERLKWAGLILAKALPNFKPQKIAFFLRANSNLYTSLNSGKYLQFKFFDLTDDFELNLKKLNSFQPTILSAPASVLQYIAQAQELRNIEINPRKILSVAEVLEPNIESYIESVFKQKLHQVYQCTEGFLGITNHSNGKFYLNEEYIHIEKEWIDKKSGRFIPIITDFTRTTQPIVRYRLDDILIEDFSDKRPFTCLKSIEGRADDVLYFKSGDKLKPIFSDTIRQAMTLSAANFNEYRITQISPRHLEVQITPLDNTSKIEISNCIKNICNSQNCEIPKISYQAYQQKDFSKKLRRIERKFQLPSQEII